MPPEIIGTGNAAVKSAAAGTATMRINLAIPHLTSAAACSRRTQELEISHSGEPVGPFWDEILAQATAAVLISVAALEAYVNELFIDHEKVLPELRVEVMTKLWELYELKPPLEKLEFALLLKQGQPFDRGAKPYQDVAALIKLRNGLVHFKPEWFDQQKEHATLSTILAAKVKSSPFLLAEPLFPRAWAGSNCTIWAVRSVSQLIVEFERRAGIERATNLIDRFCP